MSHKIVWLAPAVAILAGWSVPASGQPALSAHIDTLGNPPCLGVQPDTMTCSDIVVEGLPSETQRVYILISGVDLIRGLEFGLEYPPSVTPRYWATCGDGAMAIAESGWPSAGTGIAVAWNDGLQAVGPDSLAVIGVLEVAPGSTGVIRLTADPRTGRVAYVDALDVTDVIPGGRLGQADAGGEGEGTSQCGSSGGWLGGLSLPGESGCDEEPFALTAPSVGTAIEWDCGASGISGFQVADTIMVRGGEERVQDMVIRNTVDRVDDDEKTVITLATSGTTGFHTSENIGSTLEARWIGQESEVLATPDLHPRRRVLAYGQTAGNDGSEDVIVFVGEVPSPTGQRIYAARISRSDGQRLWEQHYFHPTVGGDNYVGGVEVRGQYAYVGASVESASESRMFAFRINIAGGEVDWQNPGAPSPVVEAGVHVADVFLDWPVFYVAGRPSSTASSGPGVVFGFDGQNGNATYCRTFGVDGPGRVDVAALEVDEVGDVYVAGAVLGSELSDDSCLFVAKDRRTGIGSPYFAIIPGTCSPQPGFQDFLVTDGGAAYVLGAKYIWRLDTTGTIRWHTHISCAGGQGMTTLEYSRRASNPLAGVVLAAGSFRTPDLAVCDVQPCTYVFGIDHNDGEILASYATTVPFYADLASVPQAIVVDDLDVFVASDFFGESRDVRLSRYIVEAGTVGVRGDTAMKPSESELHARAVGSTVVVEVERPAVVRLYDVNGRMVGFQTARRTTETLSFPVRAAGVYFVAATTSSGGDVRKVVVSF